MSASWERRASLSAVEKREEKNKGQFIVDAQLKKRRDGGQEPRKLKGGASKIVWKCISSNIFTQLPNVTNAIGCKSLKRRGSRCVNEGVKERSDK